MQEGSKKGRLEVSADIAKLAEVIGFIKQTIHDHEVPAKKKTEIELAVEEVFVNIASYSYPDGHGTAEVSTEVCGDPPELRIEFADSGIPYDPVEQKDPDVTLPAGQRRIGGLGIFLAKKMMDEVRYEYKDGKNVLTLIKLL